MRRLLRVGFLALALATAACGDEENRLSAEDFREQANEICADFNRADDEAAEEFFGDEEPSTEEIVAFFEDSALPRVRNLLDDLDELAPPESLEEEVDGLLAAARQALAEVEQGIQQDPEGFFEGEDPFADVDPRAIDLGLDACVDDT